MKQTGRLLLLLIVSFNMVFAQALSAFSAININKGIKVTKGIDLTKQGPLSPGQYGYGDDDDDDNPDPARYKNNGYNDSSTKNLAKDIHDFSKDKLGNSEYMEEGLKLSEELLKNDKRNRYTGGAKNDYMSRLQSTNSVAASEARSDYFGWDIYENFTNPLPVEYRAIETGGVQYAADVYRDGVGVYIMNSRLKDVRFDNSNLNSIIIKYAEEAKAAGMTIDDYILSKVADDELAESVANDLRAKISENIAIEPICEDGFTYNNGTCQKEFIEYSQPTCPENYIEQDGACVNIVNNVIDASMTQDYVCPTDYVLNKTNNICEKTSYITKAATATKNSICPTGYTLNGDLCEKNSKVIKEPLSVKTYTCNKSSLGNVYKKIIDPDVNFTCSNENEILSMNEKTGVKDLCLINSHSITPIKKTIYTCNDGDTLSYRTCTNRVVDSKPAILIKKDSPYCKSGYTLTSDKKSCYINKYDYIRIIYKYYCGSSEVTTSKYYSCTKTKLINPTDPISTTTSYSYSISSYPQTETVGGLTYKIVRVSKASGQQCIPQQDGTKLCKPLVSIKYVADSKHDLIIYTGAASTTIRKCKTGQVLSGTKCYTKVIDRNRIAVNKAPSGYYNYGPYYRKYIGREYKDVLYKDIKECDDKYYKYNETSDQCEKVSFNTYSAIKKDTYSCYLPYKLTEENNTYNCIYNTYKNANKTYICPDGFEFDKINIKCVNDTYAFSDDDKLSLVDNDKCKVETKVIDKPIITINNTCPESYSLKDVEDGKTCVKSVKKIEDSITSNEFYCDKGELVDNKCIETIKETVPANELLTNVCPDTYVLNKDDNICEKTVINTKKALSKTIYSCSSGYELDIDNKTCSKVIIDSIPTIKTYSKYCNDGYELDSDTNLCKKVTTTSYDAKVNIKYTCQSGYELNNDNMCEKTVEDKVRAERKKVKYCMSGYTLNEDETQCEKEYDSTRRPLISYEYTCNTENDNNKSITKLVGSYCYNYKEIDSKSKYFTIQRNCYRDGRLIQDDYGNYICSVINKTPYAPKSVTTKYCPDPSYTYSRKGYQYMLDTEDNKCKFTYYGFTIEPTTGNLYSCPDGEIEKDGKCYEKYAKSSTSYVRTRTLYTCPIGYTKYSSTRCIKKWVEKEEPLKVYSCYSGYTLSEDKKTCIKTYTTSVRTKTGYKCKDGDVLLYGTKCKSTVSTLEPETTKVPYCPNDYKLTSDKTKCYKQEYKYSLRTYTYLCKDDVVNESEYKSCTDTIDLYVGKAKLVNEYKISTNPSDYPSPTPISITVNSDGQTVTAKYKIKTDRINILNQDYQIRFNQMLNKPEKFNFKELSEDRKDAIYEGEFGRSLIMDARYEYVYKYTVSTLNAVKVIDKTYYTCNDGEFLKDDKCYKKVELRKAIEKTVKPAGYSTYNDTYYRKYVGTDYINVLYRDVKTCPVSGYVLNNTQTKCEKDEVTYYTATLTDINYCSNSKYEVIKDGDDYICKYEYKRNSNVKITCKTGFRYNSKTDKCEKSMSDIISADKNYEKYCSSSFYKNYNSETNTCETDLSYLRYKSKATITGTGDVCSDSRYAKLVFNKFLKIPKNVCTNGYEREISVNSKTKTTYSCKDGDTLEKNTCYHIEDKSYPPEEIINYRSYCPSGYIESMTDSSDSNICYKYSKTKVNANRKTIRKCSVGYSLESDNYCHKKTISVKRTYSKYIYVCNEGYKINGTYCYGTKKLLTDANILNTLYCNEGDNLSNDKCLKITTDNLNVNIKINYDCIPGYKKLNDAICTGDKTIYDEIISNNINYCEAGYILNGDICEKTDIEKVNTIIKTNYSCNPGYTLSNNTCEGYKKNVVAAKENIKTYCPDTSYIYDKDNNYCYKYIEDITGINSDITYKCPDGETLDTDSNGNKLCYITVNQIIPAQEELSPKCNDGFVLENGSCVGIEKTTVNKVEVTTFVCDDPESELSETECKTKLIDRKVAKIDRVYTCPEDYILFGDKCYFTKTTGTYMVCENGALINGSCVKKIVSTTNPICTNLTTINPATGLCEYD